MGKNARRDGRGRPRKIACVADADDYFPYENDDHNERAMYRQ
jgi:hypothetical protein